ncbi:MAG: helix-turn-helix transcriptional regulator, partial [Ruminococcus sp.]|nr:helix-turn-helix transcriptional regulator [Candidatus Copronaster equi]
ISNCIISLEEAETALRCMRLSGLNESEALESLDELAIRIRMLTDAKIVQNIIENNLSPSQTEIMKRYWYNNENTAQIGREMSLSQANVYRTLTRANDTVKMLMTPLVQYHNDLPETNIIPLYISEVTDIAAAQKRQSATFGSALRDLRVSYAITPEHLARNLKISQTELLDIESGKKLPAYITASRYTALFNAKIKMEFYNGRGAYECFVQH